MLRYMNQEEIIKIFLKDLYEVWASGRRVVSLNQIAEDNEISKLEMKKAAGLMESQGLISNPTLDWHFQLTDKAVLLSEHQRIIAEEERQKNEKIRELVLDTIAKVYEEKGPPAYVNVNTLTTATNSKIEGLRPNLELLCNLNYIKETTPQFYSITQPGRLIAQKWRQRVALINEFDEISILPPKPRGKRLQKFLAKIIESHGWSQEEGVQTSNEEMDIIVFRAREYYLLECKWEKNPIQAGVIRELFGKLGNRIDVRGIVASVTGFTKGAVKQAEDYSGQKIILLFGPEDIKALIYQTISFDDLLNQKYKELVTKKKAIFS